MTSLRKKTILIVDDEPFNVSILSELLSKYKSITAKNGQEALLRANNFKPDLIILDIMMPEMDGFEVAKRLKENPLTNNIPIIFVTAKSDVNSFIEGFDVGGDEFITKPYKPNSVLQIVENQLNDSDESNDNLSNINTDQKD